MASRSRRRQVGPAIAVAAAAAGVGGLIVLTTVDDEFPTGAAPAAEESTPAPPQTVAGLIADLTARPDAAGPAGPLLREGLRGLVSEDEGLRQQSALQVSSIVISDQALEPQYATAARLALFHAMTSTAPAPSAPTGPPSCLEVRPGTPPAVVQEYARQVLERLPAWEVDGFPVDEAGRLRDLVSPIAAGRSTLGLGPCPVG